MTETPDTTKKVNKPKLSIMAVREKAIKVYVYFVKTVFTVVILFAVYNVVLNLNSNQLRFDAFVVPISLEERGYTGKEISGRISDQVKHIRNSVTSHVKMYQTVETGAEEEEEIPEFEVPGAGISLNTVMSYMQMFFGQPVQRVYGSITEAKGLHMMVRISGIPSKMLINKKGDIEKLINQAAEHVLMHLEPFSLALYYKENKNIAALTNMVEDITASSMTEKDKVSVQIISSFIFSLRKNYIDAVKAAEHAVKLDPKHSYALHNYSLALFDVDRLDESVEVMRRLTKVFPDWSTHNNMAYILMIQGKHDEAIDEVQHSIEMKERCAQCFDTWATILDEKGETQDALIKVQQAMDYAVPGQFDYYYDFLAKLHVKLENYQEAIHAYEQVILTNPKGSYALPAVQAIKKLEKLEALKELKALSNLVESEKASED